ncbi:hypothetical protein HDU87_007144 [Geranomyces variabilis]|uniref:USP domain-containing protein n=1 Tax=Geranomyces variabilis TaxID=109894 RepID=A0AAD5TEA4_9FUNG|nr:hypothetical protein HDU87_007144 [Geranomyces variabilis]
MDQKPSSPSSPSPENAHSMQHITANTMDEKSPSSPENADSMQHITASANAAGAGAGEKVQYASSSKRRALSSRHLEMIAIGGTIGTGLFVISRCGACYGGPAGCTSCLYHRGGDGLLCRLGEMATFIPISGSFNHYAGRFVDPAFGFTCGWNYYLIWALTPTYRDGRMLVNHPILAAGQTEFFLSAIKVTAIVVFVVLGVIIDLGGIRNGDGPPLLLHQTDVLNAVNTLFLILDNRKGPDVRPILAALSVPDKQWTCELQEDTVEFMACLLEALRKETANPEIMALTEAMSIDKFTSWFIKVSLCRAVSLHNLPHEFLHLALKRNQEFMQNMINRDFESRDVEHSCGMCACAFAEQQYEPSTFPRILFIQLKRFEYTNHVARKLDVLDVQSKLDKHIVMRSANQQAKYVLCSFIAHEGHAIASGHYVTYVHNEKWIKLNDGEVMKAELDVQAKAGAYLLCYVQMLEDD